MDVGKVLTAPLRGLRWAVEAGVMLVVSHYIEREVTRMSATVTQALQLKNVQHDFTVPHGFVGVTVRRGTKWQVAPGTIVDLWECDRGHAGACPHYVDDDAHGGHATCVRRGQAQVLGWWTGALIDLPEGLLALEHEPTSRTFTGLLASLRRAYGPKLLTSAEVTALAYLRLSVA